MSIVACSCSCCKKHRERELSQPHWLTIAREKSILTQENRRLKEALSYYANPDNWTDDRGRLDEAMRESGAKYATFGFFVSIIDDDDKAPFTDDVVGGRRAREVLQENEKE